MNPPASAAQVGGIGIAPGANINYETGHAIFEATHGTAPKYADLDKVNPGSVILSGEMMFRYMGWTEAADLCGERIGEVVAIEIQGGDAVIILGADQHELERHVGNRVLDQQLLALELQDLRLVGVGVELLFLDFLFQRLVATLEFDDMTL